MLRLYDSRSESKVWVDPDGERLRILQTTPADAWGQRRVAIVADSIRRVNAFNGVEAIVEAAEANTPASQQLTSSFDVIVGNTDSHLSEESFILVRVGSVHTDEAVAEDEIAPAVFRCLCLLTPYRDRLTVEDSSLTSARRLYNQLQSNVRQWRAQAGAPDTFKSVQGRRFEQDFRAAINDDLALDVALSIAQQVIDHDMQPGEKLRLLLHFDSVFGFGLEEEGCI